MMMRRSTAEEASEENYGGSRKKVLQETVVYFMARQNEKFDFLIFHDSRELASSFDFLRILYVVEGNCKVIIPQETVQLNTAGMILLNPMEEAKIEAGEGFLAAVLLIPFFELLRETGRTSL